MVDWAGIWRIVKRLSVSVVDTVIGTPSDKALRMQIGADAVLVNTAVAGAENPLLIAKAMKLGVAAGQPCLPADMMPVSPIAQPSGPTRYVPVRSAS